MKLKVYRHGYRYQYILNLQDGLYRQRLEIGFKWGPNPNLHLSDQVTEKNPGINHDPEPKKSPFDPTWAQTLPLFLSG